MEVDGDFSLAGPASLDGAWQCTAGLPCLLALPVHEPADTNALLLASGECSEDGAPALLASADASGPALERTYDMGTLPGTFGLGPYTVCWVHDPGARGHEASRALRVGELRVADPCDAFRESLPALANDTDPCAALADPARAAGAACLNATASHRRAAATPGSDGSPAPGRALRSKWWAGRGEPPRPRRLREGDEDFEDWILECFANLTTGWR